MVAKIHKAVGTLVLKLWEKLRFFSGPCWRIYWQNLDTQYTVGVAGGVPVTFISVGENNNDDIDGFLDIINFLIAKTTPPQVLSTSYGFDEPDVPASIAKSVAEPSWKSFFFLISCLSQLCNAHMQLGARGVSILFSSGDGGVSGSQSQTCTTFIPTFPSGCPFVTSVWSSLHFWYYVNVLEDWFQSFRRSVQPRALLRKQLPTFLEEVSRISSLFLHSNNRPWQAS